ncbi:MAG: HTTM domain-containing protein [Flavobacterium sp.]|uniref:HTTM domain-containing protein n=1 Tax=Flavobacterium sp. TaxID=239 RepID=UPI001217332F|nr:HTTM domain-containing protein [Flavobacterium sp.]RZJ67499.1 MAG: HTTM domain-containing protein [Flavobacterium sp.]
MHPFLSKRIDNSPLVLFRIAFGFLLAFQCFGHLFDGWIDRHLTGPKFTFAHIGLEWLQPLGGNGMYFWFAAMGIAAVGLMFGFYYRISLSIFLALWTIEYWMQKTTYNNHHYLIILLCVIMLFLPANRYLAFDSRKPDAKSLSMPYWCRWILIAQMAIVYFYAAIAKLYPDWLNGTFSSIIHGKYGKLDGLSLLGDHWVHVAIAWSGFLFDLLIIPMILWKRTRIVAIVAFIGFHLFNSVTLDIGIFPYLAMSFALFFFEPETIRKFLLPNKPIDLSSEIISDANRKVINFFIVPFLLLQLLLPLRHWLIKGDVLWTEEGHRLSWRMMLRDRKGTSDFTVIDRKTKDTIPYKLEDVLTKKQIKGLGTHPDMIWQMAQYIRKDLEKSGKDVAVYVDCKVSVNRHPEQILIDPNVDLAHADWNYFGHCDWILLYE